MFVQGNDDVYLCVKDDNSVSVSAASVSGRTHPEDQSQVTDALKEIHVSFFSSKYWGGGGGCTSMHIFYIAG